MKAQVLVAAAALLLVPTLAVAQARMPHKGAAAVGGEVGVFLPQEGVFSSGVAFEGTYEYYLDARNSLRLGGGYLNPRFENEHTDSLREVLFAFDLVHNWEGGSVHPFVGAGIGPYFLQFRDNGNNSGDGLTKLGGTIFGGAEFFTSKTVSVKGEARYHIVSDTNGFNPSGLALTIGLKGYF